MTAAEKAVNTMGYGGVWDEAMYKCYFTPWTNQTGISVKSITPYDFSKVVAMHNAGQQELDVVELGPFDVVSAIRLGMTTPLDFNVIDKSALSPLQLKLPNAMGAPSISTCIVYNKKKVAGAGSSEILG